MKGRASPKSYRYLTDKKRGYLEVMKRGHLSYELNVLCSSSNVQVDCMAYFMSLPRSTEGGDPNHQGFSPICCRLVVPVAKFSLRP